MEEAERAGGSSHSSRGEGGVTGHDTTNAVWAVMALAGLAYVLWKGNQDTQGGGGGRARGGGGQALGRGGGGGGLKLGGGLGQVGGNRSADAVRQEMANARAAREARLRRFEGSESANAND